MTVENAIYTRLAADLAPLVGDRLYPVDPEQDVDLPYLVYQVTGAEPVGRHLLGAGLVKHELTIDYFTVDYDTTKLISDAVRTSLDTYQSGPLNRVLWESASDNEEEEGYHGQHTYSAFYG